ncbi:MAG: PqqD family protein [Armatimonadota bacterium]|nr:PqqD family protein [Armatimonadota bacterium]
MVPRDAKISRHPKVVHRELSDGEGAVLLNLESGAYYGVNEVGAVIWSLLDGTRTLAEVVDELRGRLQDVPDALDADVQAFLSDLQQRNLIVLQG